MLTLFFPYGFFPREKGNSLGNPLAASFSWDSFNDLFPEPTAKHAFSQNKVFLWVFSSISSSSSGSRDFTEELTGWSRQQYPGSLIAGGVFLGTEVMKGYAQNNPDLALSDTKCMFFCAEMQSSPR